jgi:hypothetical protein
VRLLIHEAPCGLRWSVASGRTVLPSTPNYLSMVPESPTIVTLVDTFENLNGLNPELEMTN